jgi:hypothetical protein
MSSAQHQIQTTNTVLMVRPVDFAFNAETAVDNEFQHTVKETDSVLHTALAEFEKSVQILKQEGIHVLVLEQEQQEEHQLMTTDVSSSHVRVKTPDAVFPNNWFGTSSKDNKLIVYTMAAANRRAEARRINDVRKLLEENGYIYDPMPLVLEHELPTVSQSSSEEEDVLEGTGVLVIDHIGGVAYVAKSVRCHPSALDRFMKLRQDTLNKALMFETKSSTGKEFYHTNVMLSIGTEFAVICSQSIVEQPEHPSCVSRAQVLEELSKTRTIIDVTLEQAERCFCANILELRGNDGVPKIVMSTTAYNGFTQEQRDTMSKFGKLVPIPIADAIEFVGGGSARCMLAEVFLPRLE